MLFLSTKSWLAELVGWVYWEMFPIDVPTWDIPRTWFERAKSQVLRIMCYSSSRDWLWKLIMVIKFSIETLFFRQDWRTIDNFQNTTCSCLFFHVAFHFIWSKQLRPSVFSNPQVFFIISDRDILFFMFGVCSFLQNSWSHPFLQGYCFYCKDIFHLSILHVVSHLSILSSINFVFWITTWLMTPLNLFISIYYTSLNYSNHLEL